MTCSSECTESARIIESNDSAATSPQYWDGRRGPSGFRDANHNDIQSTGFTFDNLKAIRFTRREDAERTVEGLGLNDVTVRQHWWCS